MIAFGKFHKRSKFEIHVTRNDVIMMTLPKTMENADLRETSEIIYHSKGLMRAIQNASFIKFE